MEKGCLGGRPVVSWLEAALVLMLVLVLVLVLVLKMAEVRAAAGPGSRCWSQDATKTN
jgi:hypothetical protein